MDNNYRHRTHYVSRNSEFGEVWRHMIPKPKKFNKTTAKNKLDKLFSLKIRARGNQLEGKDTIKSGGNLQCLHIFGRANLRLRWEPRNAICGDAGHHIYYTYHPMEWYSLITKYFGEELKWLEAHRNEKIKFNELYYIEKLNELV